MEKAQGPLVQAQQNAPQVRAMVQRTAIGATRDPALRDLLNKYGIDFKIKPAGNAAAPGDSGQHARAGERAGRVRRPRAMNPPRAYSSFTALLIFFAAVAVMDIDQVITVHRKKLALMEQYDRMLKLQQEVDAQTRWVAAMKQDLLRLAPGDPEAFRRGDGPEPAAGAPVERNQLCSEDLRLGGSRRCPNVGPSRKVWFVTDRRWGQRRLPRLLADHWI